MSSSPRPLPAEFFQRLKDVSSGAPIKASPRELLARAAVARRLERHIRASLDNPSVSGQLPTDARTRLQEALDVTTQILNDAAQPPSTTRIRS